MGMRTKAAVGVVLIVVMLAGCVRLPPDDDDANPLSRLRVIDLGAARPVARHGQTLVVYDHYVHEEFYEVDLETEVWTVISDASVEREYGVAASSRTELLRGRFNEPMPHSCQAPRLEVYLVMDLPRGRDKKGLMYTNLRTGETYVYALGLFNRLQDYDYLNPWSNGVKRGVLVLWPDDCRYAAWQAGDYGVFLYDAFTENVRRMAGPGNTGELWGNLLVMTYWGPVTNPDDGVVMPPFRIPETTAVFLEPIPSSGP